MVFGFHSAREHERLGLGAKQIVTIKIKNLAFLPHKFAHFPPVVIHAALLVDDEQTRPRCATSKIGADICDDHPVFPSFVHANERVRRNGIVSVHQQLTASGKPRLAVNLVRHLLQKQK